MARTIKRRPGAPSGQTPATRPGALPVQQRPLPTPPPPPPTLEERLRVAEHLKAFDEAVDLLVRSGQGLGVLRGDMLATFIRKIISEDVSDFRQQGTKRRRLGLTSHDLASAADVTAETDKKVLHAGLLSELATALGVAGGDMLAATYDPTTVEGDAFDWSNFHSTPTTLSGYGIADAQGLDSDLTAIAALTTTSYGRALLELADQAALQAAVNVEDGATADQTAADLRALGFFDTSNDGAASGLDADLLDGSHAAAFAAASALTSHTGDTSNPHSTTAAQVGADPVSVASLSALQALTLTNGEHRRMLGRASIGDGGEGDFVGDTSDLSSTLVLASVTSTAVNDSTETVTKTSHGLVTGDAVISEAQNGLTTETLYYAIYVDDDNFKLATSYANALAGTAINLTGTTNFTVKKLYDPLEAIYVRPSSGSLDGSNGAWVRQDADVVTPQMCGCFEGGDETANTAALKACFDLERPVEIIGSFDLDNKVVRTGVASAHGHGEPFSKLTWKSGATAVGLVFYLVAQHDYVIIEGFALRTEGTSGDAITVDQTGQSGSVFNVEPRAHIEHMDIRGATELSTYFDKGIYAIQPLHFHVVDNYILGGTSQAASYGIHAYSAGTDSAALYIVENKVLYFDTGIKTTNCEGLWIFDNNVQACNYGIDCDTPSRRRTHAKIIANQSSCLVTCILVTDFNHAKINDNEIDGRSDVTGSTKTGLQLQDVRWSHVLGNEIRRSGTDDMDGIVIVNDTTAPTDLIINDNMFFDNLTGITIPSGVSDYIMGDENRFYSCATNVSDSALAWAPGTVPVQQSAVASAHTGDTSETVLATIKIPGGTMGPNGRVVITALYSYSGGNDTWQPKVRFFGSGTNGTTLYAPAALATSQSSLRTQVEIANRNSESSQVSMATADVDQWGNNGAVQTATRDMSGDVNVYLNGVLTNGSDTITLEYYRVEVIYGE